MFCPQCGTKSLAGPQHFCRECGADMSAAPGSSDQAAQGSARRPAGQAWGASSSRPSFGPPVLLAPVIVKDNTMKTLLLIGGLLLLLPLAIPLVFGTLVAGVVTGAALVALAVKLAPVLALGVVLYWIVTHRRRTYHSGR